MVSVTKTLPCKPKMSKHYDVTNYGRENTEPVKLHIFSKDAHAQRR